MIEFYKYMKSWQVPVLLSLCYVPHSGVGWDAGSVPRGLKPGGTQASFSEGQLMLDSQLSSVNVSALVGKQAVLSCTIKNVNNHSISWIRHRDTSLLAVNNFVYTTSHRVKVHHNAGSDEWRLVLQPVSLTDEGWYSCQVSTTPHLEHRMYLGVIQPNTRILGPQERYIEKGSTINLTCIIHAGPLNLNPSFVFWNYNGKIITYDRERGGTVVISDRGEQTTSSLIITHATAKDSGQYQCDPSASYPQHVNVHVINTGGPSDAVRRSHSISLFGHTRWSLYLLLIPFIQSGGIFLFEEIKSL